MDGDAFLHSQIKESSGFCSAFSKENPPQEARMPCVRFLLMRVSSLPPPLFPLLLLPVDSGYSCLCLPSVAGFYEMFQRSKRLSGIDQFGVITKDLNHPSRIPHGGSAAGDLIRRFGSGTPRIPFRGRSPPRFRLRSAQTPFRFSCRRCEWRCRCPYSP